MLRGVKDRYNAQGWERRLCLDGSSHRKPSGCVKVKERVALVIQVFGRPYGDESGAALPLHLKARFRAPELMAKAVAKRWEVTQAHRVTGDTDGRVSCSNVGLSAIGVPKEDVDSSKRR